MAMPTVKNLVAARCSNLASPPVMRAPNSHKTQKKKSRYLERDEEEEGVCEAKKRRHTQNSQIPIQKSLIRLEKTMKPVI